ncbi:MAG: tetratricopeptide repeat protein [Stellaceae bacterium]
MAPLDTLSGESFLAEFEAVVGREAVAGRKDNSRITTANATPPPERRAVNWANALAKITEDIQARQGRRSAESLLRNVGARIARDLLTPLPESRDAFEPTINRALSSLDWGWVAITERDDAIVFEHRAPWPFENRTTLLPSVLEGFFSDTLQRLSGDDTAQVESIGKYEGALVFEWRPARSPPELEDVVEPQFAESGSRVGGLPVPAFLGQSGANYGDVPAFQLFELPRLPLGPALTQWQGGHRLTAKAHRSRQPNTALVVAAIVFFGLFGVGVLTGGGNLAGAVFHRIAGMFGGEAVSSSAPKGLQGRARAGDTHAQIALALSLAGASSPDYTAAAHWLQRAATAGSAKAQYDLGVMYETGVGVKHDPVEAAILFMNAAATGQVMAQYRLGIAYEQGLGVKQNGTNAAMWYERAARQGVRAAQTALGRIYANGNGVAVDPVAAYAWYRLAEENGDATARDRLAPLWASMNDVQRAAARKRALALIGDVGTKDLPPGPGHRSIEEVLAQAS